MSHHPLIRGAVIAVACALLVAALFFAGRKDRLFRESRTSLYTLVTMTVVSRSESRAEEAMDAAFSELDRIGRLLNFYAEDSELSRINRNAGIAPVKVSAETLAVIAAALRAARETEGGFDVTVGPIVRLWDFTKKTIPTREQIEEARSLVGYRHVLVDEQASTVFLDTKGMQIDLGGIIKGYAADRAAVVLRQHGIASGIVAVAGDISLFGKQPDGRPWRVGIQHPRPKGEEAALLATLDINDGAISTSGDYQRFFMENGVRYHHLLNPETGFPQDLCRSVTIVAPQAVDTDAFATGIFILGPEKGIATLERLGMDGVIVDATGEVLMTKGIRNRVQMVDDTP
jgi:thiamine biosynthesis lipoprotein